MIYNTIALNLLANNKGEALMLTGINAGAGPIAVAATGCAIYLYNGTPPVSVAEVDLALSSLTGRTLLGAIKANPGSNYGVSFATAAGGVIAKPSGETWNTGTFPGAWPQGANVGVNNLTIDYMIFASLNAGDNGYSVNPGTWPRIMATAGLFGSGVFDIPLTSPVQSFGGNFGFSAGQFQ